MNDPENDAVPVAFSILIFEEHSSTLRIPPLTSSAYQFVGPSSGPADGFKKWLLSVGPDVCCVDVYTVGVHARKSWITFQSVLGSQYQVGVIAGPETSYDPNYWVVSRRGIWLIARSLAGYLYSKYEIAVGVVPAHEEPLRQRK